MCERLTDENYMNEAFNEAFYGSRNNHGGPFGAVIVKDGVIIGKGHNSVIKGKDPTAHAEIVAIRHACSHINNFDLSGSVLYTTCEPCPMCFSAVYWANIKEVIFSLSRYDAEIMGFKDNHIYEELSKEMTDRNIRFTKMEHSSVKKLMEEWSMKPDKFLY
jgi:guanine deaminase